MTAGVSVRHNFETAHRLPHLGTRSKCFNLHGHSWQCEVTVAADSVDDRGMVVEFGEFKRLLRSWIDTHFDHGVMLGAADPLVTLLSEQGCKVYTFVHPAWPTVEAVADELARISGELLQQCDRAPDARVLRVTVRETAVNSAMWGEL